MVLSGLALIFLNVWLFTIDIRWVLLVPGIIVGLLILSKPFIGLLLFSMLVPLESSFLSFGGGVITGTRYLGIFVFVAWLFQFLLKRKRLIIPPDLGIAMVFLLWGVLSYVWAINQSITLDRMLTAAQLILLAVLIIHMVKDQKQTKQLIAALFIGCFIAALLGFLGVGVKQNSYLLTLENQGAKEYGAYVGIVFLIGSFLLVFGNVKSKVFGIICLLMTIVPLIRINQRGVFLAIALAWVMIALITKQKFKMIVLIALFFLTIDFLTAYLLSSGVINTYIAERLTVQSVIETGGTGRTEIWKTGWQMFINNIILGTGWGNFPVAYSKYSGTSLAIGGPGNDPHGDIMGIAGELGSIGLIFFLIFLGRIFKHTIALIRKNPQLEKNLIAILVIALLAYCFSVGLTSTFIWRKVYWIVLGLAMIMPRIFLESDNKELDHPAYGTTPIH